MNAVVPAAARHWPVLIVGGGQSGLSVSYYLRQHAIEHLVLEKHRVGHAWREERWDSFCLVTPNWQCQLPGYPYAGAQPHGFMDKAETLAYVEGFARSFDPPLREGVTVTGLRRGAGGGFELDSTGGAMSADQVVVAAGGYHIPHVPRMAERLPPDMVQVHSAQYRNPQRLPSGAVLVVGSGQSGCQIAEDLHLAGRTVHLSVGSAPRAPRQYRGRDVVDWLHDLGYYDMPVHEHPLKERVRNKANHYLTGRDGGREIDLRRFAQEGMRLYGRLKDIRGSSAAFDCDLRRNLDQADAVAESIKTTIDSYIEQQGIAAPARVPYRPVWEPEREIAQLDFRGADIRSVVWCIGFRTDFSWIELPVFDGRGHPGHTRGVTSTPGLYFVGLPWLYTWGSGRFSGIDRDARYLAERIVSMRGTGQAVGGAAVNELALGS